MRIWLAPSRYAPHIGGIETVTQQLAHELLAAGDEVTVLTHRHPADLPAEEMIGDIPVRRLRFESPNRSAAATIRFLRSTSSLRKELDRLPQPDVIHLHGGSSQMFHLTRYANDRGILLLTTTHGEITIDAHHVYQRSAFLRAAFRYTVKHAAAVTAPSRYTLEEAAQFAPSIHRKGTVVPNGIRADSWHIQAPPQPSSRVLSWGRLEPQKGFDRLVAAWPYVREQVPDAELRIAGEGSTGEELVARNAPGVLFLGRLDQAHLKHELQSAQFAAVPSRLEAFGMSALEALAAGRKVFHAGLPVLTDLVGPHGWVAPHDDPKVLASALLSALSAPPTVVPAEAVERFHWPEVVTRYRELYNGRPVVVGEPR